MKQRLTVLLAFFLILISAQAQKPAGDSLQAVEIIEGTQNQRYQKLPDGTELHTLAGKVKVRQGTTIITCDSMAINLGTKIMEAFGRVHINETELALGQHIDYKDCTGRSLINAS